MSNWVRSARGYLYTETQDEVSGQEVYIYNPAGSGATDRPVVGSSAMRNETGSIVSSCLCRTSTTRYPDGDVNSPETTYLFSTMKQTDQGRVVPTPGTWRMDGGTQTISNPTKSNFLYLNDVSHNVDEPMTFVIPIFSFSIPVKISDGTAASSFMAQVISDIGKVNTSKFSSPVLSQFPNGSVMFATISGGTTFGPMGQKSYAFECHFSVRLIPDFADDIITDTAADGPWNSTFNPYTGKWDIIVPSDDNTWRQYKHTDLGYYERASS